MSDRIEIVSEIRRRRSRLPVFAGSVVAGSALLVMVKPLVAIIACMGLIVAVPIDIRRTRTPLYYREDLDQDRALSKMYAALEEIAACGAVWYIPAHQQVEQDENGERRYSRKRVRPRYMVPPFLRTNVLAVRMPLGLNALYFLPDRVFAHTGSGIDSYSYDELSVTYDHITHAEDEPVPEGARVLRTRWKYETRMGRPDRRYNNNYQIPIVKYTRIQFRTASGLDETIQVSKADLERDLSAALEEIARRPESPQSIAPDIA